MNLTLRKLTAQDEKAFFEGMKAWEGESLSWYSFAWKEGMTYSEMLTLLENESAGINLALSSPRLRYHHDSPRTESL